MSLIEIAKGSAKLSEEAHQSGGYYNDLISASADNLFILTLLVILKDDSPVFSKVTELLSKKSNMKLNPKPWFSSRKHLDVWLSNRSERLVSLPEGLAGYQVAILLNKGRESSDKGTVYDLANNPNLSHLYLRNYTNEFVVKAVIPAIVEYLSQGGSMDPIPKNMSNAIDAVFDEGDFDFRHPLRDGLIDTEDLWRAMDIVSNEKSLNDFVEEWFGNK